MIWDLLNRLRDFYGPLAAPPSEPFAVYVWEVLARGTTPVRRDASFAALKRLPALTPDALARAPRGKVEAAVAQAGSMQRRTCPASSLAAGLPQTPQKRWRACHHIMPLA